MAAPHLTSDQFRQIGHRMVDFVADYMGSVQVWPVLSRDKPDEVLARLPDSASPAGYS